MRTVGYIPKEDMKQKKEPVTEQGGTATPPNSSNSSTPPETPTGGTGKKGRKKE